MGTDPEIIQAQISGELFQKVCAEINAKVPLEFGKFLRGEGASIAKTALGYTKMAKRAPLDLRAYRRAFGGNHKLKITITTGTNGSELGRGGVWYEYAYNEAGKPKFVRLESLEYGKFPPVRPVPLNEDGRRIHYSPKCWRMFAADYRDAYEDSKAEYDNRIAKYRPLQGLSKSSWYQIIRDLGFSESQALQLSPKRSIPKQVRNRFIACGRQIKMGFAREYKYTGSGRWYVEIENRSTAVIKGGGASILHRAIATRKAAFLKNLKYNIYNRLDKIIERHPYIQWG